jgi:hypothetical protein
VYVSRGFRVEGVRSGVGRIVSDMDSRVLWRAVMAACDGREDSARWLATR